MNVQSSPHEKERIARLNSLNVLNTSTEPFFEEIIQLTAKLSGCTIVYIGFTDENREWIKSSQGLEINEIPREYSFTSHIIKGNGPLLIEDAQKKPSFSHMLLVQEAPHIRFYAAFPLTTADGYFLGVLSIADTQPRKLTALQQEMLSAVSREILRHLESRQEIISLQSNQSKLLEERNRLQLAVEGAESGLWDWNLLNGEVFLSETWKNMLGYSEHDIPSSLEYWKNLVHPEDLEKMDRTFSRYRSGRSMGSFWLEYRLRCQDGDYKWILCRGNLVRDGEGNPSRVVGWHIDIHERTTAMEQLRESEHLFRVLSESANVFIRISDSVGNWIYLNNLWRIKIAPNDLMGIEEWEKLIPTSHLNQYKTNLLRALEDHHPFQMEYPLLNTEGKLLWISDNVVPRITSKGEFLGLIGTSLDITTRMHQEAALRESQNFLESIVNHLPLALFCKDSENEFRFTLWNQESEQIFGHSKEDALGKNDFNFWPRDQAEFFRRKDEEVIKVNHRLVIPEEPVQSSHRGLRWLRTTKISVKDSSGHPRYILGISEDITNRKEKDRILHEEQEKLQTITQNIGDAIWLIDPELDRLIYASSAYERIWERPIDTSRTHTESLLESIHPDDRGPLTKALRKYSCGTYNETYRILTPSHQEKWIQERAFPIRNSRGDLYRVVSIATDITEKVNQEKIIQEQQMKMVASSKMSSLGEMAGGIAHEINNPLAIIQGRVALLSNMAHSHLEGVNLEQFLKGLLSIQKTTQRIERIVRGLRAFSRSGDKDPFQVNSLPQILEDTLELCRERFRHHGVRLEVGEIPEIDMECRGVQISQVLLNLLNNAFDAVETQSEPWVRIEAKASAKGVVISVTDSGQGISSDLLDRIMTPFFTTKEIGKGSGLGLSISKGIAEDHGGSLKYSPNKSHTRFILSLPKKQPCNIENKEAA